MRRDRWAIRAPPASRVALAPGDRAMTSRPALGLPKGSRPKGEPMAAQDRLQTVRDCYRAYEVEDRSLIERHLSPDFKFYSPLDVGIDRDRYFELCWPNASQLSDFDLKRLVEAGDNVFVTYESTRADGKRFRNTEVMTFDGDQVCQVEVYFGWDLVPAGALGR